MKVKKTNNAFKNCISLKNIILNDSLISIGNHVFENCNSLEEIIIPKNVNEIGYYAFETNSMKIYVYFNENEIPEGWSTNWYKGDLEIHYGYEDSILVEEEKR